MAYNNGYPINYPQYYGQYQQPQLQGTQMSLPQQMQQPQIQNGGFVSVRNEEEARNYPVGLGTSVTFITDNRQHVYSKTMGFSQLDRPIFDKYRLVKEETESESTPDDNIITYAEKSQIEALQAQINDITAEIEELRKKQSPKKKEAEEK